jgi:5'-methylthioadenosine phosphorylase
MLAVLAGTGFYSLGRAVREVKVKTEHGTAAIQRVSLAGEELLFLPRHGKAHTIPPHRINYRANIAALGELGVSGAICVYACGIISKYRPGDIVLAEDFMALWTPATFHDDFSGGMKHADFTMPFSTEMDEKIVEVASANSIPLKKGGIIAATSGPRFETKAEIRALKNMGANLVNMTAGNELALLGEAEIDHAAIAVGTNYAAGIGGGKLRAQDSVETMRGAYADLIALISGFVQETV